MRLGWLGASRLGSCTPGWHQGLYGSALLTTLFSQSGSGLHDWGVKLLYGAQPPVISYKSHSRYWYARRRYERLGLPLTLTAAVKVVTEPEVRAALVVRTAGIGDIAGGLGIGNSSEQRRDGRREEKRSRLLHRIRDGVRTELCECVCQV